MKEHKKNEKILGIIGARSGSKSIPDKNIYPLLGKPLIGWIIESAAKSKYINKLVCSTDSEDYAKIARAYGAETPFIRPKELANDTASDIDFLTHCVNWLEQNQNWKADIILRLPPTTPLCKTESIDACIEILLNDPQATSCRTIAKAPKHPGKLWKIDGDQLLPYIEKSFFGFEEPSNVARQLLKPEAYCHIDVIAVSYNTLIKQKLLTGEKVRFVELDQKDAVDIDSEIDFIKAEILLKRRLGIK